MEDDMLYDNKILIGRSGDEDVYIYPSMANRHGLIAGATGTGKTVTLKVLAESFSDCGVPVFLADAKGDLAGMCRPGENSGSAASRVEKMGLDQIGFTFKSYPSTYWDVLQKGGIPLRTTISEMGPLLLSRILGLNELQSNLMTIIFRIADEEGLLLYDTKDLKAMITYVGEHAAEYQQEYGNIARQSLGAITRSLVALETVGGESFFGEPALDIRDWLCTDYSGKGIINILDCQELMLNPVMYSTFLLWMMSELFEILPEAGDLEKPKMVFFFDEAHMLFDDASKTLLNKIEQVVKLIRSKGVGIYFITQNPADIPDGVLGQLGNKIQHALHAYTPKEQKGARAAAQSFRENPEFDTYETLTSLGIGEALISVLDESGIPTVVKKCKVLPPQSLMGPIDSSVRESIIRGSLLYNKYYESVDSESAYELLMRHNQEEAARKQKELEEAAEEKKRLAEEAAAEKKRLAEEAAAERQRQREEAAAAKAKEREEAAAAKAAAREEEKKKKAVSSAVNSVASTAAGTVGREVGNTIGKKIGGTFGKKIGGNVGATLGRGILKTLFSR